MKLFNGKDTIEFEKNGNRVTVTLDKTQVNLTEITVIEDYVIIVPNENGIQITYELPNSLLSFPKVRAKAKTHLEKLRVACQLSALQNFNGDYRIPFIHPDNLYFAGENLKIVHYGLSEIMIPQNIDENLFLKETKALILSIFQSKLSYESLLEGMVGLRDAFSTKIVTAMNIVEVFDVLHTELMKEKSKVEQSKRLVSRNRFNFYRLFSVIALIFTIISAFFLYQYKLANEKQDAIVRAQTSFITNNYARTQTDLEEYEPTDLPKSANYILAVSSVNLSDLTATQKESILSTLSIKTDDNTLYYWVSIGRGTFDEALNLAQNLGDDQLTLLAYTDLYETTKLNTKMAGDKKQKLLQEYTKQIETLTKKLQE